MPLVAHTELPTFERLRQEGEEILTPERAAHQDIRELHIGLLNMMPDTALEATERQFLRLLGACNQIVQFHVHLFTIEGLPRNDQAQAHIDKHYESFEKIRKEGLDGLIISGANVSQPYIPAEDFWEPLTEVFAWAKKNVTSIMCSCLATHALIQHCYGIERTQLPAKRWGVFSHQVIDRKHPLVADINTRFDVPHSRFNEVFQLDMERHGLKILATSQEAGVHLAVSPDGFRIVFFQGHPEYDQVSLLKEYKREVYRFFNHETEEYPVFPENYFNEQTINLLKTYAQHIKQAKNTGIQADPFPEALIFHFLDNTWRDTAKALFNNWLGKIYQITNQERHLPFMPDIDPDNPLNLSISDHPN